MPRTLAPLLRGAGRVSRFLNDLARPFVAEDALAESYRQMAADEVYEKEAAEWVGALESETWRGAMNTAAGFG